MKTLLGFNKIQFGIDNLCVSSLSDRIFIKMASGGESKYVIEVGVFFTRLSACKSAWMPTWVFKT